jgi:hypothetical protein
MKIIKHGEHIMAPNGRAFLTVGFPSAYGLVKEGLPVLGRISEFEPTCRLFKYHLVDPLTSWSANRYEALIETTDLNHDLYIMMPSTHGHGLVTDKAVAEMCAKYPRVKGLITKFPEELDDYSSHSV